MGKHVGRPLAIVTGANGGMGRACARIIGATRDLVLTDASPALEDFARELEGEGFTVAGIVVGDLGAQDILVAVSRHAEQREGFEVLIHTAGLGPSAPWRRVIEVNYVASVRLLDCLTPFVRNCTAAVLIASVAGHMLEPSAELEAILTQPLSPRLCDELEPLLLELAGPAGERALGTLSYCLSKKKVIDLCVGNAARWGSAGARIVSISPGMTYTPMGRHEAEIDPLSGQMVAGTPIGRWGTPMEIALTADFLVSRAAGFITGSDVKVDGGSLASAQLASREGWLKGLRQSLAN